MNLDIENSPLTICDQLNEENLRKLAGGEISAIWHKNYYPEELCNNVLGAIRLACEDTKYTLTDDLQSLGTSIGEAAENEENKSRYFATSSDTIKLIRDDIFSGVMSPIDKFRLELDEMWPKGANIGRGIDGNLMLSGIIRRWTKHGHANPHIDQLDIPILRHFELSMRIGVNVYLSIPEDGSGGEIKFWGKVLDERSYEYAKRADYGLNKEDIGLPLGSIKPGKGDLIAFDAARIHSVAELKNGERVTSACFVGVPRDADKSLVLFA